MFGVRTHRRLGGNISRLTGTIGMALNPGNHGIVVRGGFNTPRVAGSNIAMTGRIRLTSPFVGANTRLIGSMTSGANSSTNSNAAATAMLTRDVIGMNVGGIATNTGPVSLGHNVSGTMTGMMRDVGRRSRTMNDSCSGVRRITAVSTGGSPRVNGLVTSTVHHMSGSNIVAVRRTGNARASVNIIRNVRFSHNCLSPCFIASARGVRYVVSGPCVLVCSGGVSGLGSFLPVLRPTVRANHPLLIVTRSMSDRTLAALMIGHLHTRLGVYTIGTPNFNSHHGRVLRSVTVLAKNVIVDRRGNLSLRRTAVRVLNHYSGIAMSGSAAAVIGNTNDGSTVTRHITRVGTRVTTAGDSCSGRGLRRHLTGLTNNMTMLCINTTSRMRVGRGGSHISSTLYTAHTTVRRNVIPNNNMTCVHTVSTLRNLGNSGTSRAANVRVVGHTMRRPLHRVISGTNGRNTMIMRGMHRNRNSFNCGTHASICRRVGTTNIISPTGMAHITLRGTTSVTNVFLAARYIVIRGGRSGPTPVTPNVNNVSNVLWSGMFFCRWRVGKYTTTRPCFIVWDVHPPVVLWGGAVHYVFFRGGLCGVVGVYC